MTFPLGVLQNDIVNFIPEMPRWKREPIFKVDVAHYAHVFLKFDEKFWDDEEWLLYAHSRKGYYPMFSGFDSHLTEKQFQGKDSVSVPIAKQFLTINEKWVLVKFMKALGTFCV